MNTYEIEEDELVNPQKVKETIPFPRYSLSQRITMKQFPLPLTKRPKTLENIEQGAQEW